MDRDIAILVGEITALATLITNSKSSNTVVFINYSGHVDEFSVSVHLNGWRAYADPDIAYETYLKPSCIDDLKQVKHQLIKLARGSKVNFAYLPYEVEEVKHYRFA